MTHSSSSLSSGQSLLSVLVRRDRAETAQMERAIPRRPARAYGPGKVQPVFARSHPVLEAVRSVRAPHRCADQPLDVAAGPVTSACLFQRRVARQRARRAHGADGDVRVPADRGQQQCVDPPPAQPPRHDPDADVQRRWLCAVATRRGRPARSQPRLSLHGERPRAVHEDGGGQGRE